MQRLPHKGNHLEDYLNGTDNAGGEGTLLGDLFTDSEQNAISVSTVDNGADSDTYDKLYLLKARDAKRSSYGFTTMATLSFAAQWATRSAGRTDSYVAVVYANGKIFEDGDKIGGEAQAGIPLFEVFSGRKR